MIFGAVVVTLLVNHLVWNQCVAASVLCVVERAFVYGFAPIVDKRVKLCGWDGFSEYLGECVKTRFVVVVCPSFFSGARKLAELLGWSLVVVC